MLANAAIACQCGDSASRNPPNHLIDEPPTNPQEYSHRGVAQLG